MLLGLCQDSYGVFNWLKFIQDCHRLVNTYNADRFHLFSCPMDL